MRRQAKTRLLSVVLRRPLLRAMKKTNDFDHTLTWPITINSNEGSATDDQLAGTLYASGSPQKRMRKKMKKLIFNLVALINRSAEIMLNDVIDQSIAVKKRPGKPT